jgi:transglutaminase-like putative cysteine protease
VHIRYGYSLDLVQDEASCVTAILDVHPAQRGDITQPEQIVARSLSVGEIVELKAIDNDANGNLLRRYEVPPGGVSIASEGVIFSSGFAESGRPTDPPAATADLPPDVVPFLLPSRNCPEGELTERAWSLFRHVPAGWDQVLAICDYVNAKLRAASSGLLPSRTAGEALQDGTASMDDFAHVAIAFCRALDIPARYCRGYLLGPDGGANLCGHSFCAWFEVYLDHAWWTADARAIDLRIGRILVARGADAADAPILAGASSLRLTRLECFAEPIEGARYPATTQDRAAHWRMVNASTGS